MALATAGYANDEMQIMNSSTPVDRARDDLVDGRNGRVVGENDDNVLESIGKAVVAPLAGADEEAEAGHAGAGFDAAHALPHGSPASQGPTD
jgi:hypothetical protein